MSLLPRRSSRTVEGEAALLPHHALEFESPSAAIIATPVPPLSRAMNLLVFLLVVSTLIAGGAIPVDKIVTANGKLVADAPNIVIQPFDPAIVDAINVKKGDVVRKGQVLARLNPTLSGADLAALKNQVAELSAQTARLKAETANQTYIIDRSNPHSDLQAAIFSQRANEHKSTLRAYDQKIDELKTEIAGAKAQAALYRERLGIASEVEGMRKKLLKLEVGSKLNAIQATDNRLDIAAALSRAEVDATKATRRLGSLQAERDTYIQHWKSLASQELAEASQKLVQAEQQHTKANLHNRLVVLTAPGDAVVLSVAKISVGSVVTSAEPLIQLVPLDTALHVEADISGIDSGYVRPGDQVTVKLDTLPFLQYGSARGSVRLISADSFSPDAAPHEVGSVLPNRPRDLYYKSSISLDELRFHDTPQGFRLMPGMPVTAEIKVGARSVLSYFVNKILPVAYDSLHEPGA